MLKKIFQSHIVEKNVLKIDVLEVREMGSDQFKYIFIAKDNYNTYVSDKYDREKFINKYQVLDKLKKDVLGLPQFRGLSLIDNNYDADEDNAPIVLNSNVDIIVKGFDFL